MQRVEFSNLLFENAKIIGNPKNRMFFGVRYPMSPVWSIFEICFVDHFIHLKPYSGLSQKEATAFHSDKYYVYPKSNSQHFRAQIHAMFPTLRAYTFHHKLFPGRIISRELLHKALGERP
jgi:hypothetical protein